MFGFFDDPFDYALYRRPRQQYTYDPFFGLVPVRQSRARRSLFDTFFDPFTHVYFYDDSDEENKVPKPTEEKKEETKPVEEKKEETKQVEEKKPKSAQPWSYSKVWSSHSRGGVEEVREKTYDSRTGDTIESQTRRIGDRWCRIDTTTAKDGHSISKETWHNVSDHEADAFKAEWVRRRGIEQPQETNKAVEHTDDKKDDETRQDEKAAPPPSE